MELEIVRAKYKTGRYIGKLIEMKEEENRALFQVLAVETHPQQGDLHQPKQIDVPLFHQRKALAIWKKHGCRPRPLNHTMEIYQIINSR